MLIKRDSTGTHQFKQLVTGKAAKPRSFKKFRYPVGYEHSKSDWITATIFKNWFHYSFVLQVTLYYL